MSRSTYGSGLVLRRGRPQGRRLLLILLVIVPLGVTGCSRGTTQGLPDVPGYQVVSGDGLGAPSMSVTESDGSSWRYDRPHAGRLTLLYFGYTSCPDVCPTTMADVASALTALPPAVRNEIWVQFVSTDPHRDTSRQLATWLDGFDPTFHGGRAPIADVISAARHYGVAIVAPKTSRGDYQVSHGAQLFVLDQHGRAVGFFDQLAGADAYARMMPALVRRYG